MSETAAARGPAAALTLARVRPSRGRGQNFLVQAGVADRIVAAAQLEAGSSVIEIGPGLGILSDRIMRDPIHRLHLIEIDGRLATALAERFAGNPRVTIHHRDALAIDVAAVADGAAVTVIANLPFSTATAILERLCSYRAKIRGMVLMFQREVAERIRARPAARDYCALSVYTALYWQITGHFRVAAGNFHPRPRVDAEVLVFAPRDPLPFAPNEEPAVLATVRAAFAAPRKTLRNALMTALAREHHAVEAALAAAAIAPSARAATLTVADLVRLARALNPKPRAAPCDP